MKNIIFRKRLVRSEEEKNLRREIERSKTAIDSARNHFEQVIDPTLIDCYIYELNAAQLRYQFLLAAIQKPGGINISHWRISI